MSIQFQTTSSYAYYTLPAPLTIGTGSVSMGVWYTFNALPLTGEAQSVIALHSTYGGLSLGLVYWDAQGGVVAEQNGNITITSTTPTVGSRYYGVFSRNAASVIRCRMFDEIGTKLYDGTRDDGTLDLTTLDTIALGNAGGGYKGGAMNLASFKLQTGVDWTDEECWAEAQTHLIQKPGGVERIAIRLWNTTNTFTGMLSVPQYGHPSAGSPTTSSISTVSFQPKVLEVLGAHLEALTVYSLPDSTTAVTMSHTCTGNNRYVIMAYADGYNEHGAFDIEPKYSSSFMTFLTSGGVPPDLTSQVRVYGLVNPPTGVQDFKVDMPLGNGREAIILASYAHVNQTSSVFYSTGSCADFVPVSMSVTGSGVSVNFLTHYQNSARTYPSGNQTHITSATASGASYYLVDMAESYGRGRHESQWALGTNTGWSLATVTLKNSPVTLITKTVKPTGGGDYTTLQSAMDALKKDLRYANEQLTVDCYEGNISGAACDYLSWATDAERFLTITSPESARHSGIYSTTNKSYISAGFANGNVGLIREFPDYTVIEYMQIEQVGDDNGFRGIYNNGSNLGGSTGTAKECTYRNNIIKATPTSTTYWGGGVAAIDGGTDTMGNQYIYNNLIYGWNVKPNNTGIIVTQHTTGLTYCYNNTVVDCDIGIDDGYNKIVAQNNIVIADTIAFNGVFHPSSDYNTTTTSSATGGTHDRVLQSFNFVNSGSKDYSLSPTDTGARGYGKNLSGGRGAGYRSGAGAQGGFLAVATSSVAFTAVEGDTIVAFVAWGAGGASTLKSVTDNAGNYYYQIGSEITSGPSQIHLRAYRAENAKVSSSMYVRATLTDVSDYLTVSAMAVSNASLSASVGIYGGQVQTDPGSNVDDITTGIIGTPSTAGQLLVAAYQSNQATDDNGVGTSFTSSYEKITPGFVSEYKLLNTLTATSATFFDSNTGTPYFASFGLTIVPGGLDMFSYDIADFARTSVWDMGAFQTQADGSRTIGNNPVWAFGPVPALGGGPVAYIFYPA